MWKVEARNIGLQYVGSCGMFTGHQRDSLFSCWPENRPSVVTGLKLFQPKEDECWSEPARLGQNALIPPAILAS